MSPSERWFLLDGVFAVEFTPLRAALPWSFPDMYRPPSWCLVQWDGEIWTVQVPPVYDRFALACLSDEVSTWPAP